MRPATFLVYKFDCAWPTSSTEFWIQDAHLHRHANDILGIFILAEYNSLDEYIRIQDGQGNSLLLEVWYDHPPMIPMNGSQHLIMERTSETAYCAVSGPPNKLEFHTGRGPANFKEFLPFSRLGNPSFVIWV